MTADAQVRASYTWTTFAILSGESSLEEIGEGKLFLLTNLNESYTGQNTTWSRHLMPEKTDWLLVALATSGQGMLSPVQVQKTMFIFKQGAETALPAENFYNFVPYNYGPFNADIYRDLDTLEMGGLTQIFNRYHGGQRRYAITQAGRSRADTVRNGNIRIADYMTQVTRWVESKSFADLIRAVYETWPAYRANSVFVDPSAQ